MADPQQQPELDVVQHPTLGPLKFPKDMPPEERNASINRLLEQQKAKAPAQQPSAMQVIAQPTDKTDKEYMGYRGAAGVAGATIHGLNKVGEGVQGAVKGVYDMGKDIVQNPDRPLLIPDKEGKYKGQQTILQKYTPYQQVPQIPQAIRDINASPDPLTHYADAAEDTASQGAGQALTAVVADKLPGVVSDTAKVGGDFAKGYVRSAAENIPKMQVKGGSLLPPKLPKLYASDSTNILGGALKESVGEAIKKGEPPVDLSLNPIRHPIKFARGVGITGRAVGEGIRNAINPTDAAAPMAAPDAPAPTAAAPDIGKPISKADVGKAVDEALGNKPTGLRSGMAEHDYKPAVSEFHVTSSKTGITHVFGDVSPEQAVSYKNATFQEIKANHPQVAKIIDGKRVAVKPAK